MTVKPEYDFDAKLHGLSDSELWDVASQLQAWIAECHYRLSLGTAKASPKKPKAIKPAAKQKPAGHFRFDPGTFGTN